MWPGSFVSLSLCFPILVLLQTTLISPFDSSPKVPLTALAPSQNTFHMHLICPHNLTDLLGQWGVPQNFPSGFIWCVPHPHHGIDDLVSAQDMSSLITYLIKLLRFTCQLLCCCASLCVGSHNLLNLTWQWNSRGGLYHFHLSLDNTICVTRVKKELLTSSVCWLSTSAMTFGMLSCSTSRVSELQYIPEYLAFLNSSSLCFRGIYF